MKQAAQHHERVEQTSELCVQWPNKMCMIDATRLQISLYITSRLIVLSWGHNLWVKFIASETKQEETTQKLSH